MGCFRIKRMGHQPINRITHCKDSQYEWMTTTHIQCFDSGTYIILYYGNYNHQYMVLVYRIFRDPQCWDLHSHNLTLN